MIVVDLLLATICFGVPQECYPILVGRETPKGEYSLTQRLTEQAGYGGDVIQFYETNTHLYAIHRVWNLKPEQQRNQRLLGSIKNRYVTGGCINVSSEVYNAIRFCCMDQKLVIK